MRPSCIDARLDDGADVVGVDMAVPQSVAAHHHDRVAEGIPGDLELIDVLVGCGKQEHHLVAGAGGVVNLVSVLAAVKMTMQFRAPGGHRIRAAGLQACPRIPVRNHRCHLGGQLDLVGQRSPVGDAEQGVE